MRAWAPLQLWRDEDAGRGAGRAGGGAGEGCPPVGSRVRVAPSVHVFGWCSQSEFFSRPAGRTDGLKPPFRGCCMVLAMLWLAWCEVSGCRPGALAGRFPCAGLCCRRLAVALWGAAPALGCGAPP